MNSNENYDWYDVTSGIFDVYGFDDGKGGINSRIPKKIAEEISDGVLKTSFYSAGGRVRFRTNSDGIGLRVKFGTGMPGGESDRLSFGFTLFRENEASEVPVYMYYPTTESVPLEYEGYAEFDRCLNMRNYTLTFPCFVQILSCEIGIMKGSMLDSGKKYENRLPIIFYGSSITHGCAASNSGNTYEQMISRKYNFDYVNLGFSGNAMGESKMADYIASREMCAFVCDYDHNAPDVEHLMKTYPTMYKTVRKSHPDIPYIAISRPDFDSDSSNMLGSNKERKIL